jgi:hypothetical protein
VKVTVRAPATTANLGAGFDCAALALDLWNEVVITDGGTPDRDHLGVQAFERIDPADGLKFEWFDRIPRERGLGSSASIIALGLVAAAHIKEREPDPEWLLSEGLRLEGHADNLAAALAGGACLTVGGRIDRLADNVPLEPIALVPESTVATAGRRWRPPRRGQPSPSRCRSATPSTRSAARPPSERRSPPSPRTFSPDPSRTGSTSRTAPSTRRSSRRSAPTFRRGRAGPRSRARARR